MLFVRGLAAVEDGFIDQLAPVLDPEVLPGLHSDLYSSQNHGVLPHANFLTAPYGLLVPMHALTPTQRAR